MNPRMPMRKYAERWLRVHDYDPDLFATHVHHIDPYADIDQALRILETAATEKNRGTKPSVQTRMELEEVPDPPPVVFCRQMADADESEANEHAGGTPQLAFENGEAVPVVEFDYDSVCAGVESRQRAELVTAFEMLNWVDEPFVNGQVHVGTPRVREAKRKLLRLILAPNSVGNPTLGQLAMMCGCTRSFIGKLASDFRDRYGVITPWMKSDVAREAYRLAHSKTTEAAQG
ncbi:MAG TPA: hypothetical protein PKJ00_11300 [Verrucomicrobiota bacterium]|jgi:hypothetical protein|nr:hypothetical protein [Verrucomicrobiota bacterium]HNS69502.1 hypothetical protein [Verrucomicrobiota bacterium]